MIRKILLFFGFLILAVVTNAHSQPGQIINIGEVIDIKSGSLTVSFEDGVIRELPMNAELKCFKSSIKNEKDLKVGELIFVKGIPAGPNNIQAILINILSQNDEALVPRSKPGRGGERRPLICKIIDIDPLTVNSDKGEIVTLELTPFTMIFKETPINFSELKIGDRLRLLPGKIVVLSSKGAQRFVRHSPGEKKMGKHPFPVPPEPKVSLFRKKLMDSKKDSPFGFKDPNMLRVDVLSWYEDYAKVMNDLGAYWMEPSAIWGFHWGLIQKKNEDGSYGKFDWERYDALVKHVQAHNIHVSAKIHASQPKTVGFSERKKVPPSLPDDMKAYRNFVKAVVERYDGDGKNDMPGLLYPIKHWKVEDEVMAHPYWGGTGADYAILLTNAYEVIKSVNPQATVICSMVRGYPGLGKNPRAFMLEFFQKLTELNKGRPYDVIDQHWMLTDPNTPKEKQYLQIKEFIEDVDKTARAYGFQSVPFEALEVAGIIVSEKAQAIDCLKRHVYALSCGIKKIFWSGLAQTPKSPQTERQRRDPLRKNVLILGDGTKKLAYYTYKKMVEVLDGSDWERVETIRAKNDIYIFKFIKNNNPLWILWNDGKKGKQIKIEIPKGVSQVRITEAVLTAKSGKNIRSYDNAFSEAIRTVNNNFQIILNDVPLFVQTVKPK